MFLVTEFIFLICIINNLCWLLTELIGVNEVTDQQMMLPCQITLFYSVGSTVMPELIQRTRLQLLWNTISSTKKATQNTGRDGSHCAQKKSYADTIKMISQASQLFAVISLTHKVKMKTGIFFPPMEIEELASKNPLDIFASQVQWYPRFFLNSFLNLKILNERTQILFNCTSSAFKKEKILCNSYHISSG